MSDINVKKIEVDGYTSFVATARLVCGTVIRIVSHSEAAAIAEAEEEIRYNSNHNPNQGMSFDEDEQDYYN